MILFCWTDQWFIKAFSTQDTKTPQSVGSGVAKDNLELSL